MSATDATRGDNTSHCSADVSGQANTVTVNYRYLLDGLQAIGSDQVVFEMIDPGNPCLLTPKGTTEGYRYIVMPLNNRILNDLAPMAENKQNVLLWAIGGVLIILGVIYFSVTGGSAGTLKIEVLTPLSGDAASYGTAVQRAYDLAVSEVNAAGGVDGRQIELVYEDAKCEGATAVTAAQKLVNAGGVKFILGGTCSGETPGRRRSHRDLVCSSFPHRQPVRHYRCRRPRVPHLPI